MDTHEAVQKWEKISELSLELREEFIELRRKIVFLKEENEQFRRLQNIKTLDDAFILQYFNEYKNNYTPAEIEELLKTGKNY